MVSDKIIKEIEEKVFKSIEVDAYQKFGFKCDLRKEAPDELAHLMVGYEKYSRVLWEALAKVMLSNSNDNQHIAIVGPQGIGKTSIVKDF